MNSAYLIRVNMCRNNGAIKCCDIRGWGAGERRASGIDNDDEAKHRQWRDKCGESQPTTTSTHSNAR